MPIINSKSRLFSFQLLRHTDILNRLDCGKQETTEIVLRHPNYMKYMRSILCFTVIAILLIAGTAKAESAKVLLISSDQNKSTLRSIKGIKRDLESSNIPIQIEQFTITQGDDKKVALRRKITEDSPDVLVTVGTHSTRIAKSLDSGIPIVFSSVLNPVTSGLIDSYESPGSTITGASLDISIDIQLEKFVKIVPTIRKIGVLYSSHTAYIVEQAKTWAKSKPVEIVPYEVLSAKDVPKGVGFLAKSCDGFWAIPDKSIFTPQSTKFILLESFRNRIPVMGFSPSFVKSGALFALIVDNKFIGAQAGELVIKILKGTSPENLHVTTPEAPYIYINRNTAEKLRIDVNPDFYSVAKEVYE